MCEAKAGVTVTRDSRALAMQRSIVHSEMTGPKPHRPLTAMVVGVSESVSGRAVGTVHLPCFLGQGCTPES